MCQQSISLLVYVSGALQNKGPFLVLSPLSVLENWRKEFRWGYFHICGSFSIICSLDMYHMVLTTCVKPEVCLIAGSPPPWRYCVTTVTKPDGLNFRQILSLSSLMFCSLHMRSVVYAIRESFILQCTEYWQRRFINIIVWFSDLSQRCFIPEKVCSDNDT